MLGNRRLVAGIAVLIAVGALGASARGAVADTVTCPIENGNTGVLTPAAAPGVDWAGCLLDRADLAGADLSGANLSGARFLDADFAGADLSNANLASTDFGPLTIGGTNLTGANLSGATADDAGFESANLTDANFSQANLDGAYLGFSTLTGSDLGSANLTGVGLTAITSSGITGAPASMPSGWDLADGYLIGATADVDGANLPGMNLSGMDLSGTAFKNANLSGADLANVNLQNGDLTDANLTGADLSDVNLDSVAITGTDFARTDLYGVSSRNVVGQPTALPANWYMTTLSPSTNVGYLIGPGANLVMAELRGYDLNEDDLEGANLSGAILGPLLAKADLTGANLLGAQFYQTTLTSDNLTGANVQKAVFTWATLDGVNFTGADLDGATVADATFSGDTWSDTTCWDGTNSDVHAPQGCTTPLDTTPPAASPAVTSGTAGRDGWYTSSPVTVAWNWTDAGEINANQCAATSTASGAGTHALTSTCADLAGNQGTAGFTVKIDTTRPAVTLTGPKNGGTYLYGKVPATRCGTTDSVSGVAKAATARVTTTGRDGVGPFTATCSGAVSVAGLAQPAPVHVTYKVVYGFGGFRPLGTPKKSAKTLTVTFHLVNAAGKAIPSGYSAALGSAHAVRVTLRGPGVSAVTAGCAWSAPARDFTCRLASPAGLRAAAYTVTAYENAGFGFVVAPEVRPAVNPVTVRFAA